MLLKLLFFFLPLLSLITCPNGEYEPFIETDGYLEVEAEHYHRQSHDSIRMWQMIAEGVSTEQFGRDDDENHAATASNNIYLEILPDTRTNHDEELIHGENFSGEPGKLGILDYQVKINNPGRYYVWVRAFSTGSEDNGIHVGLNGEWVESGQRMQWCEGKNEWTWASKQRTAKVHCGVEKLIYLDIENAGLHTISFSMREDGFEFDKWAISKVYELPK
ncbi:MAG: hypothetical protein AAF806_29760 [Bacteroidota bacterium]